MEIWRRVKGHRNYELSDKGRVRRAERFITQHKPDGSVYEVYIPEQVLPARFNADGLRYVVMGKNKSVLVSNLKPVVRS